MYVCTYMSKEVTRDDYEHGCDPDSMWLVAEEKMSIHADTLPKLIEQIGQRYALAIDDIWLLDDAGGDGYMRIGFRRMENNNAEEPAQDEIEEWRGNSSVVPMWLADYSFQIAKIVPITRKEFKKSGVKFHE